VNRLAILEIMELWSSASARKPEAASKYRRSYGDIGKLQQQLVLNCKSSFAHPAHPSRGRGRGGRLVAVGGARAVTTVRV
jgi:hypothetical protein